MKKIGFILSLLATFQFSIAQESAPAREKYPVRTITIEPAIGTRLRTAVGETDIQASVLVQYNLHRKLSFVSHSAFSNDFKHANFATVQNNYSYTIFQKFGVGTTFYAHRSSSAFFLLYGLKHNAYSGTLNNPALGESITTKTSGTVSDFGLLYNYKRGRGKCFFSARLYVPLVDGTDGIFENASIELGIGIKLK